MDPFFPPTACASLFDEMRSAWLKQIREHIVTSFRFEREDREYVPFSGQGGLGRMYQLFGERMDGLIEEMNEGLVA